MSMSKPENPPDDPGVSGSSGAPAPAPRWWRSLEERADPAAAQARACNEFVEELPVHQIGLPGRAREASSRRDFFKVMGLSATAVAACSRAPEQRIYPYTRKPDEQIPGVALWYASACGGCAARCGLLVKTRDGRPIKVEGNPADPVSQGAVCAVGQASVLGLYDADRARQPRLAGRATTWKELDAAVIAGLQAAQQGGHAIRVVVPWGGGPSAEAALDGLLARFSSARVVRFDPLGQRDAIARAHAALYGAALVPDYRIDAADLVVSFDADFLGTWIAPARFGRQWAVARDPARPIMLRHVQVESNLSLTGGAADERHPVTPSALTASLAGLVAALAETAPAGSPAVAMARVLVPAAKTRAAGLAPDVTARLAREVRAAGARALVLCGSEEPAAQALAAVANALLGNGATTAVLDPRLAVRDGELTIGDLAGELGRRQVGAVLFLGVNPALVDRRIAAGLPAVAFSLSTSERADETAALCKAHAPEGHALEAWSDHRPRAGVETMAQPCVAPLFETRARIASLLAWTGAAADDHAFVQARWAREVLGSTAAGWDQAVREGLAMQEVAAPIAPTLRPPAAALALMAASPAPPSADAELVLYASVGLHDGTGPTPNNGWLQELPDPISKVTWGNYVALSPARAQALGVGDGDVVEVRAGDRAVRLPALRQPGLPDGVVAIAVGHGRASGTAGRIAADHGVDAWLLAEPRPFGVRRSGIAVTLARTGARRELALSQTHASQEGRELARQIDLGAPAPAPTEHASAPEKKRGLWPGHVYEGHRWGMTIDLNKCTGCAACVVSCNAENNIPVVGEVEVQRRREMHWLRIDRYYGGTAEDPEVLQQPMMCQHCENAPCETVCPVVATVHSGEGLNQQIYNRCVGTRYCANNCPTKARRFNWFDYDRGGDLRRMVLNPDVVVRSRGVMEKCSMCVHRIEEGRALAKREGRELCDGDIQTACQQSCPAQAITFGDTNDKASAVSRLAAAERGYKILEEINVRPQVTYLTRVKNRGGHG